MNPFLAIPRAYKYLNRPSSAEAMRRWNRLQRRKFAKGGDDDSFLPDIEPYIKENPIKFGLGLGGSYLGVEELKKLRPPEDQPIEGIMDFMGIDMNKEPANMWGMINRLPSLFSQQEPPERIDQPHERNKFDKSGMYPPPKMVDQSQVPQEGEFSYIEDGIGIPRGTLHALMMAESNGDVNAVSEKGAKGAFQLMPKTAKHYEADPFNLHEAALAAGNELQWQLKSHKGNLDKALASYNYGHGNVRKRGSDLDEIDRYQKEKTGRSETTEHRERFYKHFGKPELSPQQQEVIPDKSMMYPQPKPQMAPIDKSMMYPEPKRSLQQVAQTAQAQPALNPFPWLKGTSGGYYGSGNPRNF